MRFASQLISFYRFLPNQFAPSDTLAYPEVLARVHLNCLPSYTHRIGSTVKVGCYGSRVRFPSRRTTFGSDHEISLGRLLHGWAIRFEGEICLPADHFLDLSHNDSMESYGFPDDDPKLWLPLGVLWWSYP